MFQDDLKSITQIESEIDMVKEAMTDICRLMLTTTFANGKGEIGWPDMQDDIVKMLTVRARSEGAQVAHAEAAAVPGSGTPAEGDETM